MDDDPTSLKDFFVEPQKGFWLRKRKRRNSDAVSMCSLDLTLAPEPENKRKRRLSKVASLANLLSTPMRPVMKIGASLQRSFAGGRMDSPSTSTSPRSSSPCNFLQRSCSILRTPATNSQQIATLRHAKQRLTRCWSQAIARNNTMELGLQEVKRQEAIYELWSGEDGIVEDLEFVQDKYQSSMMQLHLLSEEEAQCVFGGIDNLLKIHRSLRDNLVSLRNSAGITESVGKTLLNWIPGLNCYIGHCSNQVWARALLEEKNINKRFQEFLKQCLESSFSRRLDLWTFLDVPRSRLTKYPLLVGEILRHTPSGHEDVIPLSKTASALTLVLQQTDVAIGAAECRLVCTRLQFPHDHSSRDLVDKCTAVLCSGELKDRRGTKFNCFLFDKCFVVTRICRPSVKFTVCAPIIPAEQITFEEVELRGRSAGSETARTGQAAFRVGFKDAAVGSHRIFAATNEHVRKHWMYCMKQVTSSQENIKTKSSSPPEAKKKIKSVVPCKCMNKSVLNGNNSQFTRPFRQRNRVSKSVTRDNLV
ncbi:neuroepithelial cell-transforming gene 1 protein-like isoform X2 [Zootermopsis nevadensis]|nr:neuroepithelial cell-transforming gene 1 protein-like isoform X2 [Zootermopsis nevadensis]XP_021925850.1 neuroepithelial cell-transforming gene 1 protein-like isoform X2 [Zootermopsis nevadensis]XP_021925851.1 neuroepithelial cell-transforming gene 1 protein-like isoform X2 [Zootermopsis nevadensis]XP_021925852.1 neuroepithelial cell-transforming gene 1 protein-like isoform X2 [Zootermopsis nevadensis]XP_021925853.1 neuroepithelial cell-transforming gene 1 protein-like isoform X2 [Zootermops